MKVADFLEQRRANWRELERLCGELEVDGRRRIGAAAVTRFASLYRSACADLALADAYQLPPNTVHYLHQLVGQAHNQLYRSRSFNLGSWRRQLLVDVPQRIFRDNCVRLAFVIFWGVFLASMLCAYLWPDFSEQVLGKETMEALTDMYKEPIQGRDANESLAMSGFYVYNNAGIGLQCFACGLILGIGGLFITVSNAAMLGGMFGYMATVDQRTNFFQFVTAHGPFELTAIVLAAAAGMRLGFAIIDTRGYARHESVRRAAHEAVPTVAASVVLFVLAAGIEAFVSPSVLPYVAKAGVAIFTSGLLMFYFVMLGYPAGSDDATG